MLLYTERYQCCSQKAGNVHIVFRAKKSGVRERACRVTPSSTTCRVGRAFAQQITTEQRAPCAMHYEKSSSSHGVVS